MVIHWYPGHMMKTRRMMLENLKHVDMLCEIVDARIPKSSRNPDIDNIAPNKPRLIILNRIDLADPEITKLWINYFKNLKYEVMICDSLSGYGVNRFSESANRLLSHKIAQWNEKGQIGHHIRAMIVGIPNVGKSTFINKVIKKKSAKVSDRPGVTRGKQWFTVDDSLELLDTPGILWPKLDDETVAINLAVTGAIKDQIMDTETLACKLMLILSKHKQKALKERYSIDNIPDMPDELLGYELLIMAGKKRGFVVRGGEVDTERMAIKLLDEYRAGILGTLSLEIPDTI